MIDKLVDATCMHLSNIIFTFALLIQDEEGPFLVANLDALFEKHLKWLTGLPRVKPFYAVKCNNTPAILRMLSALGTGFDCASKV